MERLTYRDKDGMAMMKERGGWKSGGIERLAAYEDTGLEPEDLKKAFNETAILKLAAQALSTTPDHLRDLLQAEQDGRLVVHKASPGEQVWIIERDDCDDPYEISGYMFLASTGNAVKLNIILSKKSVQTNVKLLFTRIFNFSFLLKHRD